MAVNEILGYIRLIWDTFGLSGFFTVFLLLGVALYLYRRIFDRD